MAEAIFNHLIREKGLSESMEVDSCGTANYHVGDDADPRTIAAVRKRGVVINHCVRQLIAEDLDIYDYVLAMDKSNYQNILRLARGDNRSKVKMMREFDPGHEDAEVPDPYYGNERHFEEVYSILHRALSHFIEHLERFEPRKLKDATP